MHLFATTGFPAFISLNKLGNSDPLTKWSECSLEGFVSFRLVIFLNLTLHLAFVLAPVVLLGERGEELINNQSESNACI